MRSKRQGDKGGTGHRRAREKENKVSFNGEMWWGMATAYHTSLSPFHPSLFLFLFLPKSTLFSFLFFFIRSDMDPCSFFIQTQICWSCEKTETRKRLVAMVLCV